ncbi:DUF5107 domain-containing protein [Paenibacillus sp.]|uniref:DUF5107 domain-containing protein n=1 Tax=Paenibacillus sp. TaxID=58172 RepID=UPI002D25E4FF|nr:DUF5107 domain-containing protein [Paenibacillus sp.]HZG83687.1 DUF5107 domain-containing protein [Paenibacillus sp.]
MSDTNVKAAARVSVWEEKVDIPTYEVGKPDKNPMFLEKRVYQGSSGKVYPLPVIDSIEDEKRPKSYRIVFLENEYVQIQIMPELGGRIYRALDKTNGYDFVYYNRVIKPALVGLTGPWISGGIEFNWPQHHRPNTFGPTECAIAENDDGSATVWISEVDRMYGTKGMAGFTLYPGKAYLEIRGQLFNRTEQPQTFLWWANPAVAVNDETQSIFPPDVNAVFDHGKRDVSRFPIATGTYYKVDYSAGVDISRYKNIPVPTSYMAYKSDFDFVGGYDYGKEAGILHVANHHIAPGKKQWTWGHGDFGRAWDRNLTEEDGPYIELMTGVYTDNQPDFTWLQPYEEKTFKQYFMPYKKLGQVKNATIDAAVYFELQDGKAICKAYATGVQDDARIVLRTEDRTWIDERAALSPERTFEREIDVPGGLEAHRFTLTVYDRDGRALVSYTPKKPDVEPIPESAKPIDAPEALPNNEALYLAGLHLEQYRHATRSPEPYYLEGLKRDPGDIRINNAYGLLLLRRGRFAEAESRFREAVRTATRHNPNPYDGEPHFNLALALKYQGRLEEAYAAAYKSVWSGAWQDKGYFLLAQLDAMAGRWETALEHVERSLMRNYRNPLARNLKTAALRKLGRRAEAEREAEAAQTIDIGDFGSRFERLLLAEAAGDERLAAERRAQFESLLRGDVFNYLALAQQLLSAGLYDETIRLMDLAPEGPAGIYPMTLYYRGYAAGQANDAAGEAADYKAAQAAPPDYCFPNALTDVVVLERAANADADDAKARYYLGNLLYDKGRAEEAIALWEASARLNDAFPTVHRNLALAYYNKLGEAERARAALERAFALNAEDARVLFELDQLYQKIGRSPEERLAFLDQYRPVVERRDDLFTEFVKLHNTASRHEEALAMLLSRRFHPWEGGEGKVTSQYVLALVELAKAGIRGGKHAEAAVLLERAFVYPDNLGEGKLAGAQENHIHYWLGAAYEGMGDLEKARQAWSAAAVGLDEPTSAMYYNDQPPEMIYYQGLALGKLGETERAKGKFNKLVDYGERHLFQSLAIDYFAVSLPDFLVFDENLDRKNEIHCRFMLALGYAGLGRKADAGEQYRKVLELEPSHQGARFHR